MCVYHSRPPFRVPFFLQKFHVQVAAAAARAGLDPCTPSTPTARGTNRAAYWFRPSTGDGGCVGMMDVWMMDG